MAGEHRCGGAVFTGEVMKLSRSVLAIVYALPFNFFMHIGVVLVFLVSHACFGLRVLWAFVDGIYQVTFPMPTLATWKLGHVYSEW